MKRSIAAISLMLFVSCNSSPTAPTPSPSPVPTPVASPIPHEESPVPVVSEFDFSIQPNPENVVASTWDKYQWELHGRIRVENLGNVVGHLEGATLDCPGKKRDYDFWYEEIEKKWVTDVVAVGPDAGWLNPRQISFMFRFNWPKGFPQVCIASLWIKDENGLMHGPNNPKDPNYLPPVRWVINGRE
jgi:hypothetical protein